LLVNEVNGKTEAELSISYEKPEGFFNRILCFFLADWYCRWCLKKMLGDAKKAVTNNPKESARSFQTRSILLALLALTRLTAQCQADNSGIYKTFKDYQSKPLEYAIDCNTESHTIKSDQFHHKDVARVIHNDSLFTM